MHSKGRFCLSICLLVALAAMGIAQAQAKVEWLSPCIGYDENSSGWVYYPGGCPIKLDSDDARKAAHARDFGVQRDGYWARKEGGDKLIDSDGTENDVALKQWVHDFYLPHVPNAWLYTADELDRMFVEALSEGIASIPVEDIAERVDAEANERIDALEDQIQLLLQRVQELEAQR